MAEFYGNARCEKCDTVHAPTDKCYALPNSCNCDDCLAGRETVHVIKHGGVDVVTMTGSVITKGASMPTAGGGGAAGALIGPPPNRAKNDDGDMADGEPYGKVVEAVSEARRRIAIAPGAKTLVQSLVDGDLYGGADGRAKHDDSTKPPLAQLSRHALIEVANVLLWGASKYDEHNWRKGMDWSRLVNSVLRHVYAWNEGQDLDEESGLNHLSHAMCDIMFLLEYQTTHQELDDRIKHSQP